MPIANLVDCHSTNPAHWIVVHTDLAPFEMCFHKRFLYGIGGFFGVPTDHSERSHQARVMEIEQSGDIGGLGREGVLSDVVHSGSAPSGGPRRRCREMTISRIPR